MTSRGQICVQNNESAAIFVYKKKILWDLNSIHMLKLSFIPSNLQSRWSRDWKRSIEALRESVKMIGLIFKKNHNTLCFPPNILNLHCFLVPKIVPEEIVQCLCKRLAVKTVFLIKGCFIDRFQSRGQQLCKLLGIRESLNMWKEFNSHRIFFVHKHGRRFIVLYTNVAAVTSCENDL